MLPAIGALALHVRTDRLYAGLVDRRPDAVDRLDRERTTNFILVFHAGSLRAVGRIRPPGLGPIVCGLAVAEPADRLYVADFYNRRLLCVDLRPADPVPLRYIRLDEHPIGLSSSSSPHRPPRSLVVTFGRPGTFGYLELDDDGDVTLLNKCLTSEAGTAWHAVESPARRERGGASAAVAAASSSARGDDDGRHRQLIVSFLGPGRHVVLRTDVDDGGTLTGVYGGPAGDAAHLLHDPCGLPVDETTGCVFVADSRNDRVVALDLALRRVRAVVESCVDGHRLARPTSVCVDPGRRRLLIGCAAGGEGLHAARLCSVEIDDVPGLVSFAVAVSKSGTIFLIPRSQ